MLYSAKDVYFKAGKFKGKNITYTRRHVVRDYCQWIVDCVDEYMVGKYAELNNTVYSEEEKPFKYYSHLLHGDKETVDACRFVLDCHAKYVEECRAEYAEKEAEHQEALAKRRAEIAEEEKAAKEAELACAN
jgi:hypothetical protein